MDITFEMNPPQSDQLYHHVYIVLKRPSRAILPWSVCVLVQK